MCRVLTKSCWHFWRGKHKYKIGGWEKKQSLRKQRGKKKLNWLSTALVKNENQSAGPLFTLTTLQRLRGILILVFTNVLSFSGLMLCGQLWPNVLIRFFFPFFFIHKPNSLNLMDWGKAISRVWIGWEALWKLINRNPFAAAQNVKLYYQFMNFMSKVSGSSLNHEIQ